MTEVPPKPGKGPEEFKVRDLLRKHIESFLAKSDEPGPVLTDEQQFDLSKRAGTDPEAAKQWDVHKHGSKYRRNTLSAPLMTAAVFLESSDSESIPQEKRDELAQKIKTVEKHIIAVGARPFVKEDVQEVVDLVNEIKTYL